MREHAGRPPADLLPGLLHAGSHGGHQSQGLGGDWRRVPHRGLGWLASAHYAVMPFENEILGLGSHYACNFVEG